MIQKLIRLFPESFRKYCLRGSIGSWRLTGLYYTLFNPAFFAEHSAVLKGRLEHQEELDQRAGKGMAFTLRRNVHRLEKGLIMRPRRPVFALDYIEETVQLYRSLVEASSKCSSDSDARLCGWAFTVLREYFSAVELTDQLATLQRLFCEAGGNPAGGDRRCRPFLRSGLPPEICIDDLRRLAEYRRSVRWFLDRRVPRECIDEAVLVARESPSACNRQPFEFRVFDEPELVSAISSIPAGTAGYSHQIPAIAVVLGNLRAFYSEADRHLIYIDSSLAVMAFQFALEVQGISTCIINWQDNRGLDSKLRSVLGFSEDKRPTMLIAIGYADPSALVPGSCKKSLDDLRSYN